MSEQILTEVFEVEAGDFVAAGAASAQIKRILKQLSVNSDLIRRAAIISYEAELNLVIHSLGGKLILRVMKDRVVISTEDVGPGIADISLALKEGWSTASDDIRSMGFGAGMGLPNIKRNADDFEIRSAAGSGTTIVTTIYL
ncbi:MAG: anti-sigma regulatory factor [Eubacteriales bacterium]|nr:anti-sigma regulatory factor [Eubacteriales bacterium]